MKIQVGDRINDNGVTAAMGAYTKRDTIGSPHAIFYYEGEADALDMVAMYAAVISQAQRDGLFHAALGAAAGARQEKYSPDE